MLPQQKGGSVIGIELEIVDFDLVIPTSWAMGGESRTECGETSVFSTQFGLSKFGRLVTRF